MIPGDHIKVFRIGPTPYWHHGIYLGDNSVIHFTGENAEKSEASIKKTSLEIFCRGSEPEVVEYARSKPAKEVIKTAESLIGNKDYNLIWNNCEHFARYCKTGEKESEQVKDATATAAGLVATGSGVGGGLWGIIAASSVHAFSGPGIMSGLAYIGAHTGALIGLGGVLGGIGALAAPPAVAANIFMSKVLKDDEKLSQRERSSRKAGRMATKVGTVVGVVGTVGSVAGLSGAGPIGLAAIGGMVGGGMVAGTAMCIAAPAVAASAIGYATYKIVKILKRKK